MCIFKYEFCDSSTISLSQKECPIGPEANLLEPSADQCKRIILETPLLSPGELLLLKEPLLPAWKVCLTFAIVEWLYVDVQLLS